MAKLFGTDGIRGIANSELSPELALNIGRAGAYVLAGNTGCLPKILIGTDTRLSTDMLEAALISGICSVGAQVYRAGVIPSPAMAYLVRHYKMDAGIMLSASHNPMQDNGIKFFDESGYKLSDSVEEEIESLIENLLAGKPTDIPGPIGEKVGRSFICKNAVVDYVDFLVDTVSKNHLVGMKVAIDCANGATYEAARIAFKQLGAKVYAIHCDPDGTNINEECGSTHLKSLQTYVKAYQMDIGLAFDGDGDRVLAVDETGAEMDGDAIMAVCGLALKKKNKLKNNTIVATVMSNLGLQLFCEKEGLNLCRALVGDRYVIQEMKAGNYNFGGEQSGHIIFHDYNTTGDGILTGLQLLATLKESGQKMSELRKVMENMPQVLLGAKLGKRIKGDIRQNENIDKAIRELEEKLANNGRVLVRPSGTEPIVRVMLEGPEKVVIQKWAEELIAVIEKELQ
ncbi:MAG: phosphoglucosamine mutase [Defluviitaleaceae bacterium]|nr:phosphoglucosamine mutase [Defluviitaleaceae bacterium]